MCIGTIMRGRIGRLRIVDPVILLPQPTEEIIIPAECIVFPAAVRLNVVRGVICFRKRIVVSKCWIDRNVAHFGLEDLICHLLFVFHICSAELIVVVVAHDISGKNCKLHVFHIEECRH